MINELPYWMALAHVPKIRTRKKNELIVSLFHKGISIIEFFHSDPNSWTNDFDLDQTEAGLLAEAKEELSNYSFMAEDLLDQGYKIIPISSTDYSPELKQNLGRAYAPTIIYTKGNIQILKEKSIAIVGSRQAGKISLEFTDNVAKKASEEYKVVVSGFAKGVDKQALDSALNYKGQSIIVLPQGITTFSSGYKKYYKQIIEGDVLVLSTFHPKAPWGVPLAMARNPIIYGLASEIYVAESNDSGGTWSGVIDGLRKGRTIYVRKPGSNEKNANSQLILKGAKAVDHYGNPDFYEIPKGQKDFISEPSGPDDELKIVELLKKGVYSAKNIVEVLKLDWSTRKVIEYLKKREDVITIKGNPLKFSHRESESQSQKTLFD
jgi:predicted Rossmann fold nucleotide-binding protein DprA/Smf involved in DNA uptake